MYEALEFIRWESWEFRQRALVRYRSGKSLTEHWRFFRTFTRIASSQRKRETIPVRYSGKEKKCKPHLIKKWVSLHWLTLPVLYKITKLIKFYMWKWNYRNLKTSGKGKRNKEMFKIIFWINDRILSWIWSRTVTSNLTINQCCGAGPILTGSGSGYGSPLQITKKNVQKFK